MVGVAGQAGAVNVSSGDVDASLYGYVRLNASYEIDEDISNSTRAGSFGAVNTGAAEDNEVTGHFGADAVQSRIGVTATHSSGVDIKVEGDFRGGTLRLRHAYGEYKGVLMGQTWSNYTSFVGYTSTLDFDSAAGLAGLQGRIAQARYTTGPLSFSLEENANFGGILNVPRVDPTDPKSASTEKSSLPTFTARFQNSSGPLSLAAAALVKQVEYDTGTSDDSAIGLGVFGAATFQATDALSIQGVLSYSDGSNSYLYRSGNNFGAADAYVDGAGSLETISGYGANIGASLNTGPGSINAVVGYVENDFDDAQADGVAVATQHESNTNVLVNYQWAPAESVMMGVEYGYFMVDEVGGDDGDASRIQFAAQYNF